MGTGAKDRHQGVNMGLRGYIFTNQPYAIIPALQYSFQPVSRYPLYLFSLYPA
jgi:hypothetical protein